MLGGEWGGNIYAWNRDLSTSKQCYWDFRWDRDWIRCIPRLFELPISLKTCSQWTVLHVGKEWGRRNIA